MVALAKLAESLEQKVKGFYTKEEAAQVLGVSVRQIGNYLSAGKLSRVYQPGRRRVWIPVEDVQRLYDQGSRQSRVRPEDMVDIQARLEKVELQVETLKKGLGFGSPRPSRSTTDLLTLRQRTLNALAKDAWTRSVMSDLADELMTVKEDEVNRLVGAAGPTAWVPFIDLAQRVLSYIEGHPDYPDKGLDIIQTRLIRAKDRFYGLVYASTKTRTELPPNVAERTFQAIQVPTNSIERHIVEYLLAG